MTKDKSNVGVKSFYVLYVEVRKSENRMVAQINFYMLNKVMII